MNHSIELLYITIIILEIIENWFNILYQTIDEFGISWKNIYNYDKSRFEMGKEKKMQIMIDINMKQYY